MQEVHGTPKQKVESGKTGDGDLFLLTNTRRRNLDPQWERIAYIQLPKAVAYIVLSSRDETERIAKTRRHCERS